MKQTVFEMDVKSWQHGEAFISIMNTILRFKICNPRTGTGWSSKRGTYVHVIYLDIK